MASSSKPTAVHFSLIFFVMTTIIGSVVAYMMHNSYSEAENDRVRINSELQNMTRVARERDDQIMALKQVVGRQFENVGHNDRDNRTTVIGAAMADISTFGGALAQPTLVATMEKLREELNNVTAERNAHLADLNDHKQKITELENTYQVRVDQNVAAVQKANQDLSDQIAAKEEAVRSKDQEIARLRGDTTRLAAELQESKDEFTAAKAKWDHREDYLVRINRALQQADEARNQVSFERPDGKVVRVDSRTRTVYIDRGQADKLVPGISFSVYTKGHHGVARGQEDIKGAIEVVRLISAHVAECRILQNNLTDPITAGDPIYTPLWNSGQVERFSFVGVIDMTGNGKSDRDLLREKVTSHGAMIDNEIDDEGNWNGDGITVETRFLVLGKIPDPATVAPQDRAVAEKISGELAKIREQAQEHNVREVNLKDFLAYLGEQPAYRTWRAGEPVPWTLKAGAHSTSVNQVVGDRASGGTVSGAYKSSKLGPPTSGGSTSKAYGGR